MDHVYKRSMYTLLVSMFFVGSMTAAKITVVNKYPKTILVTWYVETREGQLTGSGFTLEPNETQSTKSSFTFKRVKVEEWGGPGGRDKELDRINFGLSDITKWTITITPDGKIEKEQQKGLFHGWF